MSTLQDAITRGDIELVRQILEQNKQVNINAQTDIVKPASGTTNYNFIER